MRVAPRRQELWWADLGSAAGSAPAHRRPVLVVSSDSYNRSRISTVVCLAITSNTALASAPGNVLLDEETSALDRPSVVNVSQMATVDKSDLTTRISRLDDATMHLVEIGLRRVLAL